MAATVGWESDVSLRVRSSLGISWNSRSSLAFFAASLFPKQIKTHTDQALAESEGMHLKVVFSFFATCLDSVSSSMKCSNRERCSS